VVRATFAPTPRNPASTNQIAVMPLAPAITPIIVGTIRSAARLPVRRTPRASARSWRGDRFATQAMVIGCPSPRPRPITIISRNSNHTGGTSGRIRIDTAAPAMLIPSRRGRPSDRMSRVMNTRDTSEAPARTDSRSATVSTARPAATP
jgi:hypothetical protein